MYTFSIVLYAYIVRFFSLFHQKARWMIRGQKQTFSILKRSIDPNASYVWIHAASLGEFEQGRPIIEKIRENYPHYKILLTFFSPSGYEVKKNCQLVDVVCYLPFDLPGKVNRFLDLACPSIAIFIKYEFWMNYLSRLKMRNIPTYVVSAVFRPKQIFFRFYANGYQKVLGYIDRFFVQDHFSKELLNQYHIFNVTVSGDTRFDRVNDILINGKSLPIIQQFVDETSEKNQLVLVAGSTWHKDEEIILSYFNQHKEVKLIIAPHEINKERLNFIISKIKRSYVLYSQATVDTFKHVDCLIIDCFGLLSSIYRYADYAYVGGGFGKGIHNILEAAVYHIPVIFGPNYQKFKEAKQIISENGGFSIKDASSFALLADRFFNDREMLQTSGKKSGSYVQSNIGATEIILKKIPF